MSVLPSEIVISATDAHLHERLREMGRGYKFTEEDLRLLSPPATRTNLADNILDDAGFRVDVAPVASAQVTAAVLALTDECHHTDVLELQPDCATRHAEAWKHALSKMPRIPVLVVFNTPT